MKKMVLIILISGGPKMVKAYYRETDPKTGKAKWIAIKGLRVSRNGTYIELGYDIVESNKGPSKFFWKEDFSNTGNAFGMGYFVYKLTRKDGNKPDPSDIVVEGLK
jgi:hypothetical protein